MLCQFCGAGETRTGVTSLPLQFQDAVVLVRGVPSDICDACSNFSVDITTRQELIRLAHEALDRGDQAVDYRTEARG